MAIDAHVIAFKHPHGYARLLSCLLAVATVLSIAVTVWHVAVAVTWTTLLPYVVREMRLRRQVRKASCVFLTPGLRFGISASPRSFGLI